MGKEITGVSVSTVIWPSTELIKYGPWILPGLLSRFQALERRIRLGFTVHPVPAAREFRHPAEMTIGVPSIFPTIMLVIRKLLLLRKKKIRKILLIYIVGNVTKYVMVNERT